MAAHGHREITQLYPCAGWVEHDAEELWDALRFAVRQAIMLAGARPEDIRCLGLDHEGGSVVVWDAVTGRPVYPAIVWQDRRTAAEADMLKQTHGAFIRERTGLTPDAYFSTTKLKWILDRVDPTRERSKGRQLLAGTEEMARRAGNNGDVYFVPAFTGLAAPYWDSYARGTLIGVTGGTTREHIVRAALGSTAYQAKDILDAVMEEVKTPIESIRCDGGSTCNAFLMQFQADIFGLPLEVPEIRETTALGAAYMAALGAGELSSPDEVAEHWRLCRRYEPRMSADERDFLLSQWHRAVERSREWARK